MSDTDTSTGTKPGIITKAGPATAGSPGFNKAASAADNSQTSNSGTSADAGASGAAGGAPSGDAAPNAGAAAGAGASGAAAAPSGEMNEEQLKKIFADQGIIFTGFDNLKQQIDKATKPAPVILTDEQKRQAETVLEQRMLSLYLTNGGKVEHYAALKEVANADLKDLSAREIRSEMKEAGFNDKEIEFVIQERYFQLNPDELQKDESESPEEFQKRKDFLKKKNAYGTKKLEGRGANTKQKATGILSELRQAIEAEDLRGQQDSEISSKVDEILKTVPRKVTFELGEVDNKKIDPVVYDVSEADIAEIATTLKDPATRKKLLFTEDGSLNLAGIAQMMLRNKYLDSALKAGYLAGGSRQVAEFEKTFPGRSPQNVGTGGNNAIAGGGQKGKIISAGAPQHVGHKR